MNGFLIAIFAITGLLTFGLVGTVWFNIRTWKSGRSNRLKYTTIAYICVLALFGYYAYWISQGDTLRFVIPVSLILGIQALLVLFLTFICSPHVEKSENFPSVLRASMITLVLVHLLLPAFPNLGKAPTEPGEIFVLFKFISDEVVATVCFMISIFLLFVNIILIIAQIVMFFKYRKEDPIDPKERYRV